jgi:MFS family permease
VALQDWHKEKVLQNWRVVAVLAANLALHNLQRFAPVSLFDEFRAAWNIDYTGAGALFAAYLIAYAAMLFPMGMLADRFDNKKLLMLGAALNIAASVLFALAPSLAIGLLARVMLGISGALLYVPSVRYVVTHFGQASRGQTMGWVQFGAGAGQVLGLSLMPLATVHSDLASAFLLPALLAGVLLAVQILYLSATRSSGKESLMMGDVLAAEGFKPFLGFFFLAFMASYAIAGWLPTYLRNDFGFSPTEAGLAASLSALAMSISSPLVGKLSDRLGARKPVLLMGSVLSMACFAIMVFSHDPVVIVIAAALKGVGSAMTTPVSMMFAGETFAAAGAGVAVGIASTTGQLASSASGPFFGYTLDVTSSFAAMWGVALGCVMVSVLCLMTVKERKWEGGAEGKIP